MKKQKRPLRSFFPTININSDRTVLGICMVLSLIFWLLVKFSQSFTTTRIVEVQYTLPEDRSMIETPPSTIEATVDGTGWNLLADYISFDETTIHFELPDRPNFTINSSILKSKIEQQIDPLIIKEIVGLDYIIVNMGETFIKKVPVYALTELSFAPQHQLIDSIRQSVDSVSITGSVELLDSISHWHTDVIVLNQLKNTAELTVPISATEIPELRFSPTEMHVTIPVEKNTQKDFFIPVQVLNAPDSLTFFPKKIKAHCIVGLSKYDQLTPADIQLKADFKNILPNADNTTVPVSVTKPDFVRQVKLNKESVEFFFVDTAAVR